MKLRHHAKALDAYWRDEKVIDPAFIQELEASGVNLSCAIPFRIYGDGAQALRTLAVHVYIHIYIYFMYVHTHTRM